MLSVIVAAADDNAIGKGGDLPWHLSEDLKRFKRLTKGHSLLMGRKTFESLHGVLPKRFHLVVTRDPSFHFDHERVEIIHDLGEALRRAKESEEEWFLIGGGSLYKALLDQADRLYLTRVHTTIEGADTYFPEIDSACWEEIFRSELMHDDASGLTYEFIDYVRAV